MKKSTCYRLVRNNIGATEYVLTPSYMEIFKDANGREFKIHFHKIIYKNGFTEWSATEESTGLKCITYNRSTKKEAYEAMLDIVPVLAKVLSKHTHYILQMKAFKESLH